MHVTNVLEACIDQMTGSPSLSSADVAFFEENGFIGPFDLFAADEIAALRKLVDDELLAGESPIYGIKSGRDWHLVSRTVYDICAKDAIVERLAPLIGPDILLWRSQLFYKKPGDGVTAWHQDHAFPGPLNVPSIDPPITVTAWIALDEATIENGCVELVAGTHKEGLIPTVAGEPGEGIFGRKHKLDRAIGDNDRITKMVIKPGQFFLFTNLTVHGSGPNATDSSRLGMAVRFVPTSVRVYPGLSVDGQGMNLREFGCILVRGEDQYAHNRLRRPPEVGSATGVVPLGSSYDAGFKHGYRIGFAKGERHAARGVRVDLGDREIVNRSVKAYAKEYDDHEAFERGFLKGMDEGYSGGVDGRPFDTRYGSPLAGDATGARRRPGPLRKIFRVVKKLARKL
jgi:non-haem Fe2+, alpha-ketoglutarate-dependent halogenase